MLQKSLRLHQGTDLDVLAQGGNGCLDVLSHSAACVLDEGLLQKGLLRSDFIQTAFHNLGPAQHYAAGRDNAIASGCHTFKAMGRASVSVGVQPSEQ